MSEKQLMSLKNRFQREPNYRTDYRSFMAICVVGEFEFLNEFNKAFRKQERSLKVYSEDHTRKGVKKQDLSNEEPPLDRVL